MNIEIDQSGKIENTNVDTVVAYANHEQRSILLPAKEKRIIQRIYRDAGKPHIFVYRTFSLLIFLLVQDSLGQIQGIIIDDEYPGWHFMVKNFLLQQIRTVIHDFDKHSINFQCIGKKSPAHDKAYTTFTKKQTPDMTARYHDIARFIIK